MIVPDSSSWIEYLRRTASRSDRTLTRLLEERAEIGVTEVVAMEILAGAKEEADLRRLRSVLVHLPILLRSEPDASPVCTAALVRSAES